MHTVGKVFLGLTIVAGLATMVLGTKLLQKRNDITQKLDVLKKDNEEKAVKLVAKRDELRRLRHDYEQAMLPWGRYWSDRQANVQNGKVAINAGTNEYVGVPKGPQNPIMHLYAPGDGGVVYIGPFEAESITEAATTLKPTWAARPSDLALMKPGLWRMRTQAPAAWINHFHALQTDLTGADELIAAKQKNVELQDKLIAKQNEHLKTRKDALLGFDNPGPKADALGPEFTKGLVAALTLEDEARNADLTVVDELRRTVQAEFRREQALVARNQRLVASLPGARVKPTTPAENASAAKTPAAKIPAR